MGSLVWLLWNSWKKGRNSSECLLEWKIDAMYLGADWWYSQEHTCLSSIFPCSKAFSSTVEWGS